MTDWGIVADIGGTNTRIAVTDGPGLVTAARFYPTLPGGDFCDTLGRWLEEVGMTDRLHGCTSIRIAAAGPVENGVVELTNADLRISAANISHRFGGVPCAVVNDLVAVAMLLPHLGAGDLLSLGGSEGGPLHGNLIAINVGTGFGAAALKPVGNGRWLALASETGHMAFAATTADEFALLEMAETLEDVLSGSGVLRLYEHLSRTSSGAAPTPAPRTNSPTTTEALFAAVEHDAVAFRATEVITRLLGRTAGDLVLATGAWQGAFLCGSVALGWSNIANRHSFRAAFERKGAMTRRMRAVPTAVITMREPALYGLTYSAMCDFDGNMTST